MYKMLRRELLKVLFASPLALLCKNKDNKALRLQTIKECTATLKSRPIPYIQSYLNCFCGGIFKQIPIPSSQLTQFGNKICIVPLYNMISEGKSYKQTLKQHIDQLNYDGWSTIIASAIDHKVEEIEKCMVDPKNIVDFILTARINTKKFVSKTLFDKLSKEVYHIKYEKLTVIKEFDEPRYMKLINDLGFDTKHHKEFFIVIQGENNKPKWSWDEVFVAINSEEYPPILTWSDSLDKYTISTKQGIGVLDNRKVTLGLI